MNPDWYAKANETRPDTKGPFCKEIGRVNTDGEYASNLQYIKVIIDWIYSQPDLFDSENVFIEGFSANAGTARKVVFNIYIS